MVLRYKHIGEDELTILKNSHVSDKAYKLERRGETGPFCWGRNALYGYGGKAVDKGIKESALLRRTDFVSRPFQRVFYIGVRVQTP